MYICTVQGGILLYTVCIITLRCTCELFPPRLTRPIHNRMTAAKVLPVIASGAPFRWSNVVRLPIYRVRRYSSLTLPPPLSSPSFPFNPRRVPIVLYNEARVIVQWGAVYTFTVSTSTHNRQIGMTKLAGPVIPFGTTIGEIPL